MARGEGGGPGLDSRRTRAIYAAAGRGWFDELGRKWMQGPFQAPLKKPAASAPGQPSPFNAASYGGMVMNNLLRRKPRV